MHSIKDYFECCENDDHDLEIIEDGDVIYCKHCCYYRKLWMKCDSDCDNCIAVKNVIKKEMKKNE